MGKTNFAKLASNCLKNRAKDLYSNIEQALKYLEQNPGLVDFLEVKADDETEAQFEKIVNAFLNEKVRRYHSVLTQGIFHWSNGFEYSQTEVATMFVAAVHILALGGSQNGRNIKDYWKLFNLYNARLVQLFASQSDLSLLAVAIEIDDLQGSFTGMCLLPQNQSSGRQSAPISTAEQASFIQRLSRQGTIREISLRDLNKL